MSVQVSTCIDEATKQQFDEVCEVIGVSPSNALGMLIRGIVIHGVFPFSMTPSPGKRSDLRFGRGCMKGKMWMSDDFDAPMDDFKEYME